MNSSMKNRMHFTHIYKKALSTSKDFILTLYAKLKNLKVQKKKRSEIPLFLKIFKTCLILFIAGCVSFFSIQTYIILYSKNSIKNVEELHNADAVLVLGALVHANGTPSVTLSNRLNNAYEVYERGLANKIIVSGDHGRTEYNEVRAMKNYLLDKGVLEEDIFMDHAGFDTFDSMYRARDVFLVNSLIIATQDFHMSRAVYTAKRFGIETQGYATPDLYYRKRYNEVRESLARVKAFLDVEFFKSKPTYLGEVIPITGSGLLTEDEVKAEL